MKYLVASDIHGSLHYASELEKRIEAEKPDKLILLGDLYYHGPRNSLADKYSLNDVSEILNKYKDIILCTKGNCDAEVDEYISDFPMEEYIRFAISDKIFFFTHGHRYNKENPPLNYDVLVYGHFHTGFIIKENGKIYANPGSTSIPRGGTTNSYMIITDSEIILKDIEGNELKKVNFLEE